MDLDSDGEVTPEEAAKYFKSFVRPIAVCTLADTHPPCHHRLTTDTTHAPWDVWQGKVSAKAMFNEVDDDKSGGITIVEWDGFWQNVLKAGYTEEEVMEELEGLLKGESWVDFDDGRTT